MSEKHSYVNVIKADGKYVSSVFKGVNLPTNKWELNFTEQSDIAMIFRRGEPALLSMLEVVFPDVKFSIEKVLMYKPCGCSICK